MLGNVNLLFDCLVTSVHAEYVVAVHPVQLWAPIPSQLGRAEEKMTDRGWMYTGRRHARDIDIE